MFHKGFSLPSIGALVNNLQGTLEQSSIKLPGA